MITAIIGLVLPVAAAWLILLASRARHPQASWAVTGAVATATGLGLASLGPFATLMLGGRLSPTYAAIDALCWFGVAVAAWRAGASQRFPGHPTSRRQPGWSADLATRLAQGVFWVVLTLSVAVPIVEYAASPHGQWDAWAIWNQKARFMLRAGPDWSASFALTWSQPTHPLFVALSVARLWAYAGGEPTAVPALLSLVYGLAIVAALVGALDTRTPTAWAAGAAVIAPFTMSHLVAAQTADLAVGLFITLTLVTVWLAGSHVGGVGDRARMFALAGVLGGMAVWSKNEGIVFVGATSLLVAWLAWTRGSVLGAGAWLAGLLPFVAVALWFKLRVATGAPEYFAARPGGPSPLALLTDPARLREVLDLTAGFWWRWGGPWAVACLPVAVAAALGAAVRAGGRDRTILGIAAVVAVMMLSYYAAWVASPLDTTWLVSTTFDRLMAQVWPTLVFVTAAGARG